ncbi:Putative Pirin domain-containing protein [[Torrubiella] hemipterigena]|uniref:Putative Pirin domain-containing protein n=1 Tax=[Torrubiella] hemipterigena TaxID=1531966 RepID=A0A0A1TFJ6_9HYPO|nr:Putative Pirin domain-containing protein [[Torrubiella] hemipterigena]
MSRVVYITTVFALFLSIIGFYAPQHFTTVKDSLTYNIKLHLYSSIPPLITPKPDTNNPMAAVAAKAAAKTAKVTLHLSKARGHADYGWLRTFHSFSFADWYDPKFTHFGALRVLNEDRVKANSGFPTHPHRDFEIFSYILSGELTHRDSMLKKGAEGGESDKFFRMKRGDVQFTTGGTGISHSEFNEHKQDTAHFLQIWAMPWKKGLTPRYHTMHFSDEEKRKGFLPILSPLKAGEEATVKEEEEATPALPSTIPIHADFVMAAGIIAPGTTFEWAAGGHSTKQNQRKVYVHLPMKSGKTRVFLNGRESKTLNEGDGAFVENVYAGDTITVTSNGVADAEVIILDTC